MSLTVEEIRKRVAEDKMHVSTLLYVQPLLDRIDELEKEVFDLQMSSYEAEGCPE